MNKKVLYISSPPYFDMDLSLVNHLSKKCQVNYLLDLPPYFLKSSAFSIDNQLSVGGIFSAAKFKELLKFEKYIQMKSFYVINRPSKKSYSYSNLKLQLKVVHFINKMNPDIIHCNGLLNFNFFYMLMKNKRKILLTVHDPFPHSGEISNRNSLIRHFNFSLIKNLVILNFSQKQSFIESTKQYKFRNVFNSSLSIYEYLLDFKVEKKESDKFKILFFGRISEYKGVEELLISFTEIEKLHPNVELTIAGKGKFWFDMTNYYNHSKIKILNRYLPNEELVELITNTTLVVCPYKDATQSGVLMSAFALNAPVLATDVGGFSEMIESGTTGFLIQPNNNALTKKLKELIENPDYLKKIKKNIFSKYSSGNKSWDVICADLNNFYNSLCYENITN